MRQNTNDIGSAQRFSPEHGERREFPMMVNVFRSFHHDVPFTDHALRPILPPNNCFVPFGPMHFTGKQLGIFQEPFISVKITTKKIPYYHSISNQCLLI